MKNGTASVDGAYVELQAAVLRALPKNISRNAALAWARNGQRLTGILSALATEPTEQDLSFKGPCIEFEIDGQRYEALSVFRKSERCLTVQTMIERANTEGAVLTGPELNDLLSHQRRLPVELRDRTLFVIGAAAMWLNGRWCYDPSSDGAGLSWDRGSTFILRRRK